MISEAIRKQIAEKTLQSTGSGIPWQTMFAKKQLCMGYIGGSVTQGYANGNVYKQPYPALVAEALRARGYDVTDAVCAEAGMNCMVGGVLTDSFILSKKPDFVILEFAINETTLRPSIHAFESLLRKLLTAKQPPIVCIFVLRNASGYSCESYMVPVAEHYGLPCIVLRQGLDPMLENASLQWADYADEESHPNPEGHQLLADCVMHLLDTARAEQSAETSVSAALPEPWLGAPFAGMRYLTPELMEGVQTRSTIVPKDNWAFPTAFRLQPDTGNWEMTVTGTAFVLYFEVNCLPEYGDCQVMLDGKPLKQGLLHSNSIYGWGNIMHFTVFVSAVPETHTVTLEPLDGAFFLSGAGICPAQETT